MENVILLDILDILGTCSAYWYWNNTTYEIGPQNNINNGINNYIVMTFIHFAFKQWEAANREDVYKYIYACPFLLVLSGRDVTSVEQKCCQ